MNLDISHTALSVDHFKHVYERVELSPLTRPIFTNCLFSYNAAAFDALGQLTPSLIDASVPSMSRLLKAA